MDNKLIYNKAASLATASDRESYKEMNFIQVYKKGFGYSMFYIRDNCIVSNISNSINTYKIRINGSDNF